MRLLLACLLVFCCIGTHAQQTVIEKDTGIAIINEVMFNPGADNTQYIELAFRDTIIVLTLKLAQLDARGQVTSQYILPAHAVKLTPRQIIVFAEDTAQLRTRFPHVYMIHVAQSPGLNLKTTKGTLALYLNNNLSDRVDYDRALMPAGSNPNASWERISTTAPASLPGNWRLSQSPYGGSPTAINSVSVPPAATTAGLSLAYEVFTPDNDGERDQLPLAIGSTGQAQVKVSIYNESGILVNDMEATLPPGGGTLYWNGNNNKGNLCAVGRYIVIAQVNTGNQSYSYKKGVVLSASR